MRVVAGCLLLLASGCATLSGTVSDRAESDLGCSDVDVSDHGGGEYVASGCGGSVSYTCMYADSFPIGDGPESPVCIREGNLDQPVTLTASPVAAAPAAPPRAGVKPFPLRAAIAAMRLAASFAGDCNAVAGPRGTGTADVVFAADGRPTSVTLSAPFQGTPVGACVAAKFQRVVLPAFSRGPKTTHKIFDVPAPPAAPPASKT